MSRLVIYYNSDSHPLGGIAATPYPDLGLS